MKRKGLWLSVLATALIAGSASAATFSGSGYNFFNYGGDLTNNTWNSGAVALLNGTQTSTTHFQNPGVMENQWTSGAAPVQAYDNEQLFWNYVGNSTSGTLHIGIVTGFNSNGVYGYNGGPHFAGDLFIAFGNQGPPSGSAANDNLYSLAIRTGTNAEDTRYPGQEAWENGPADFAWTTSNAVDFPVPADPYRYVSGGTAYDPSRVNLQWTQGGSSVHNFLTVAIQLDNTNGYLDSLLGSGGGFTTHWTMLCGNDVVHHTAITPPGGYPPVVPVPAAAPLGLLGMGLLALVRRVRRRPEC